MCESNCNGQCPNCCPKPTEQLISMDKQYKTRNDRPVRILCIDRDHRYPVVALIGKDRNLTAYKANGNYWHDNDVSSNDLIEISPYENFNIDDKVVVWCPTLGYRKRHFAGVNSEGKPTTFSNSKSSFTDIFNSNPVEWESCELYDPAKHDQYFE